MKLTYVVCKRGVYRHDIRGIFTNLDNARECAAKSLVHEPDDYHSFEVIEVPLNKSVEDGILICKVTRNGDSDELIQVMEKNPSYVSGGIKSWVRSYARQNTKDRFEDYLYAAKFTD